MQRLSGQELTARSKTKRDELGARRTDGHGRVFRYVFAAKTISKKGVPVALISTAGTAAQKHGFRVAASATAANSTRPAGISVGKISASEYGYVLCAGPLNADYYVQTDKGVAAGDMCILDQSTDGTLDTATNTGTQIGWVFVNAFAADSGSFLGAGMVRDLFGGVS